MEAVTGRHLLLDLWLEDTCLLERVEPLWSLLTAAAEGAGARVLHGHVHQFEPHGMTGFLLLAESHVSIHTWPEAGFVALDILTCGALDAEAIARRFAEPLRIARSQTRLCPRGIAP